MYDAALGRWHAADAKAGKYVSWSPYNYVLNNPMKFIDPNGEDVIFYIENVPAGLANAHDPSYAAPRTAGYVTFNGTQGQFERWGEKGLESENSVILAERKMKTYLGDRFDDASFSLLLLSLGYGNVNAFLEAYYPDIHGQKDPRGEALNELVTNNLYQVEIKDSREDKVEERSDGTVIIHWHGGYASPGGSEKLRYGNLKRLNDLAAKALKIYEDRKKANGNQPPANRSKVIPPAEEYLKLQGEEAREYFRKLQKEIVQQLIP